MKKCSRIFSLLVLIGMLILPAGVSAGTAGSGWQNSNGSWQYYENGIRQTGWLKLEGSWYYLGTTGNMVKGWSKIDGSWYYFEDSGKMITGWKKISGKWYFFEDAGKMITGWKKISGSWYYFETNGEMVTGWKKLDNKWYHFSDSGSMNVGWLKSGNSWYYFDTTGKMVTDWNRIEGEWYYFSSTGVMQTGWLKSGSDWYLLCPDGSMAKGWAVSGGYNYFFYENGKWTTVTNKNWESFSESERTRMANIVAREIANYIRGKYGDYEEMFQAHMAAATVCYDYYSTCTYTMGGSVYRTPFGVFVARECSCAGTTRALGLILDYLGISWTHVNPNQYTHQWCSVTTSDGRTGWADGMIGMAYYGEYPY